MSDELQRFYENKLKDLQSRLTVAETKVKELTQLITSCERLLTKEHQSCFRFNNPFEREVADMLNSLRAELDKLKGTK